MPAWLRSSPLSLALPLLLGLLIPPSEALAAHATFHVNGTVASTSFPDYHVLPGVAPGDAITGVFTYDAAAGALQGPPSSFDFYVGQLRFRTGSAGVRITSGLTTGPTGPSFALQNGGLGSTISSDLRLQDVFTLLQLQNGAGTLNFSGLANGAGAGQPAEGFRIGGAVALVPEGDLVPEAGSLVLFLPGVALLGLLRGRKRSG